MTCCGPTTRPAPARAATTAKEGTPDLEAIRAGQKWPALFAKGTNTMKFSRILALACLVFATPAFAQTEAPVTSAMPIGSPAIGGSWVVSTRPVQAHRLAVTSSANAGYLLVFDATSVPADGAVTPIICRPVAVNTSVSLVFTVPARFSKGLVMVFSTTGCYTKTISPTAFFEASPK